MLIALGALTVMSFRNEKAPPPSRIGFVSVLNLVSQIPEYGEKSGRLDTVIYEFNVAMQGKVQEYQDKERAFVADSASMNEVIRQDKIQELQMLGQAMQAFKETSDKEVARMDSEWVQPILDRLQESMQEVALEHGYTQLINSDVRSESGPPLVLYSGEDEELSAAILSKFNQLKLTTDHEKE